MSANSDTTNNGRTGIQDRLGRTTASMKISGFLLLMCGVFSVQSVDTETEYCQKQKLNDNQCALSGKWRNQLQSEMVITCKDGTISGKYTSAVGQASKEYELMGRYTQVNDKDYMVGWSVAWKNQYQDAKSVTSWTGVFYGAEGVIRTQWILSSFEDPDDFWETFITNQDTFSRISQC
ncbi:streptavidin-like [Saccostrea echinata]|uniref:streptavidin-like n=1 Tax=Saccostrea echinata TaxID=191078 RepID=UPI002A830969|nr:streptavidin-like [Saccostrea echinata]